MLIGEYIHFNYKNYELYGLSHKSPVRANPARVFKGQRQKIKTLYPKKIAAGKIKDLENTLNLFFGNSAKINGKSWTSEDMKIIQDAVIAIFTFSYHSLVSSASTGSEQVSYKYFTSIQVEAGDTLWSIAEEYADQEHYSSYKEYINEVKRMNKMRDDSIVSGQYLIIPYYSSEFVK